MRDVKRWLSVAAFSVSLGLTGCVSSSQYKKVQAERNQLQQEVDSARAEADDYKNQLGAVSEDSANKDEQITALSSEKSDLQAQLDEINQQYAEALERAAVGRVRVEEHRGPRLRPVPRDGEVQERRLLRPGQRRPDAQGQGSDHALVQDPQRPGRQGL